MNSTTTRTMHRDAVFAAIDSERERDSARTIFEWFDKLSDAGNAERFAFLNRDVVRYCALWSKWLVWDGRRWQVDTRNVITVMAKQSVRTMLREATNILDNHTRELAVKWCLRSESSHALKAMLSIAGAELPVTPEELDADAMLFNVRNGTIDLRTGELRKHDHRDLITKLSPVDYDPDCLCHTWDSFLAQITLGRADLESFLQRYIGYSMTGLTREQCFLICYGSGSNGKSTLWETVKYVLGDYAATADVETLMEKRDRGIPNDLAALKGSRLVLAQESSAGARLAEGIVKQLTGGDTITARFLFSEFFSFRPEFKLVLSTNHRPRIKGTDIAIWRRIRLVPFDLHVADADQDHSLPETLQAEAPGILAWMVRGCLEWQIEGLGEAETVTAATQDYRHEENAVGQFIEDECTVSDTLSVPKANLYDRYVAWAEAAAERPMSHRAFTQALRDLGFDDYRTGRTRFYRGLALIDAEDGDR